MRTLRAPVSPHGPARSARWAARAAIIALPGLANAAQKASPTTWKTWPRWALIASRRTRSWSASAAVIDSGWRCHNPVLSSMSVKRKVTSPPGSTVWLMAWAFERGRSRISLPASPGAGQLAGGPAPVRRR